MTFNPTRWPIRWQIAALLILTQVMAHVVTITMIDLSTNQTGGGRAQLGVAASEPLLTVLRMARQADIPEMTDRLATLLATDDRFRLEASMSEAVAARAAVDIPGLEAALANALPDYWRDQVLVFDGSTGGLAALLPTVDFAVAAQLPTGDWLVFEPRSDSFVQRVPRTVALIGLSILALTVMFLSVWAGTALVAPISDLARGAERFAGDADATDLPDRGPVEVRRATLAFNKMRQRIRKLISDRSQTLASIGHDMRTPLTRLLLRLELLDDSPAKTAMEGDIQVLERMIDDALGFLRSEHRPLALELVDIAVLAKTVADEFADHGHAIDYHGPQHLVVRCDHDLIRRVLENVIGNAAKFAGEAQVLVSEKKTDAVVIEVRDNGPGIPLDHREKVLEPFTRVEAVRSGTALKSEGFGLGLAIARDLMERHGGMLGLSDNHPQGLSVTLTLPKAAADDHAGPRTA
ncbi:sensor histidine kinase [Tabrizicola piscis]|uniref:histidine kinase n=1 Tax=Tabrizicola piscis TaxID=2494374 RepID=A0A3S8U7L3_9RHOB|nr:HAMP domain-containing sensor histidine kinase [Tabrizicola piscis]AZL59525.1 sensor histidine kinase [Tabrizicola piscis]